MIILSVATMVNHKHNCKIILKKRHPAQCGKRLLYSRNVCTESELKTQESFAGQKTWTKFSMFTNFNFLVEKENK